LSFASAVSDLPSHRREDVPTVRLDCMCLLDMRPVGAAARARRDWPGFFGQKETPERRTLQGAATARAPSRSDGWPPKRVRLAVFSFQGRGQRHPGRQCVVRVRL